MPDETLMRKHRLDDTKCPIWGHELKALFESDELRCAATGAEKSSIAPFNVLLTQIE